MYEVSQNKRGLDACEMLQEGVSQEGIGSM